MKKSELEILYAEIFLLVILIFNIFVLKTYNDYLIPVIFAIFFLFCYLLFGFEKDNKKDFKNSLLIMLIFILGYYIFIYISGIFLGFLLSGYSLKINYLIINIFPIVLFQVTKEMLRYEINTKGERKKVIIILSTIVFILADIYSIKYLYNISEFKELFEMIELYLLPSITENILLTYTSIKSGYKANLTYQFLMKLPTYFLPIVPDLGDYLDVIIRLVFPCLILWYLMRDAKVTQRSGFIKANNNNTFSKISLGITFFALLVVVYLTSGLFTYYAISIGSESMQPKLDKGDVTIVRKTSDYKNISVGDILVYKKENRVVVHRVNSITKQNNHYIFTTKGDANNDVDGYPIYENEVIGIVKFKVKYLGYPAVWLNEFMN